MTYADLFFLAYLRSCKEQGILPIPYGIAKNKEGSRNIKLNNISMGDSYAEAFSHILPYKQSGFTLSLSNNRLTQEAANNIVEKLNKNIHKLDISFNPSVKFINVDKLVKNYNFRLSALNLEGNNAGDNLVVKLAEAIAARPMMKTLNLAQNMITNKGAIAIAELLKENDTIVALYLKWNYIKAKGAAAL